MTRPQAQRTVSLWVANVAFQNDGRTATRLYHYPTGRVEACYPVLAWEGIGGTPELPIVQGELMTLYQALAAILTEDDR